MLGSLRGPGTFSRGRRPPQVQQQLADHGVNVSVSLVDYARLNLPTRGLPDLVRASVHYYNTDDELDQLTNAPLAKAKPAVPS